MITRLEIDGFKTFKNFSLDINPFIAIVGQNASGKSNLFDALKFLSLLADTDIRSAMQELRGEPQELFRHEPDKKYSEMRFAAEVLLEISGHDAFGLSYALKAQRLRYEIWIILRMDDRGSADGIFVKHEFCKALSKKEEKAPYLWGNTGVRYQSNFTPFIRMGDDGAIEIKQDGKHGNPRKIPSTNATRTALSTIQTAELPHLFALKQSFSDIQFLEINPQAARRASDRFERRDMKPDASNLAAVLARIDDDSLRDSNGKFSLLDVIASELTTLVPSAKSIIVNESADEREYSFSIVMSEGTTFSSRVISDGTIRLLALLTVLNDPRRKGVLCFEEPENGVHEGRIRALVEFLRQSTTAINEFDSENIFQVITNTHSPAVMSALEPNELVAADIVRVKQENSQRYLSKSRMRSGLTRQGDFIDPEHNLSFFEIERLLKTLGGDA